ncbi:MAG: hypothetical protein RLY70_3747 [Planctomycetota bacterium]|jgi:inosine-uridine nucleoside N-ribohydrolase
MARKVIIDADPGIDDAVALALALFDPALEVVAVTATAGVVNAEQASANVQAVIEALDPPRYPRVGMASPPDSSPGIDGRLLHGEDGLGNASLQVSRLQRQYPSEKRIIDEVRAAPDQVTLLCLGPLTNVARALQRDPGVIKQIGRLVILGGSVAVGGDTTAAAEFNAYCDPESARQVYLAPITKTIVPLDVTRQLTFNLGFLNSLPTELSRAGRFLRKILPSAFRAFRQQLGQETIPLPGVAAWLALTHPELFVMRDMAGDVETRGELTLGATVFDRRRSVAATANLEVAMEIQSREAHSIIDQALTLAEQAT